jgi:hypothetical protein
MSEPRTVGADVARRWFKDCVDTSHDDEGKALWLEAEARLAECIDKVVAEWVERGA